MASHLRQMIWGLVVVGAALVHTLVPVSAQAPPDNVGEVARAEESLRLEIVPQKDAGHHEGLFRAVNTSFLAAASTDLSLSMYQIGRGVARESGFGAQWQDSPVAFSVTKTGMAVAFAYALQRMHKTRPKTALVLGVAATAVEGWLTVRSARLPAR